MNAQGSSLASECLDHMLAHSFIFLSCIHLSRELLQHRTMGLGALKIEAHKTVKGMAVVCEPQAWRRNTLSIAPWYDGGLPSGRRNAQARQAVHERAHLAMKTGSEPFLAPHDQALGTAFVVSTDR